MLTITDRAAEKLKTILAVEGKEGWGLKIFQAGEGCCGPSYGIDMQEEPSPDEEVIEVNGLKVFAIKSILESLSDKQFDYYKDGVQEGFILMGGTPPTCGPSCGSCE